MSISKRRWISQERIISLQESITWLDTYETPSNEFHVVGPNKNTENVKLTQALSELNQINKRKKELIQILTTKQ